MKPDRYRCSKKNCTISQNIITHKTPWNALVNADGHCFQAMSYLDSIYDFDRYKTYSYGNIRIPLVEFMMRLAERWFQNCGHYPSGLANHIELKRGLFKEGKYGAYDIIQNHINTLGPEFVEYWNIPQGRLIFSWNYKDWKCIVDKTSFEPNERDELVTLVMMTLDGYNIYE